MKLSFSTLGCPEWSFSEIVSTAKDLGYDGIEIRGVQNVMDVPRIPQFAPNEAGKTQKLLADKNLEIVCLTSACYMNVPDFTQDTVYHAIAYVDTAKDMGVKYIRVLADFSPEQRQEVDESLVLSNLKKVADYAVCRNVEVLIETNGWFADSKRAASLVEKAGDNVGVIWDIHHPYRFFGESPEYTVSVLGKRIKHVHLKDSKIVNGKLEYTMMGYGDLPIAACVAALEKAGYGGSYCLEWVKRWNLNLEEPGIAFAQYASYMKNL